jgi:hypothetical protein
LLTDGNIGTASYVVKTGVAGVAGVQELQEGSAMARKEEMLEW